MHPTIMSAREMNSRGLKYGRGYRVSDTMAVENIGPVLAPVLRTSYLTGTFHRTLNYDDTTMNNETLMTDLQMCTNNQGSKTSRASFSPLWRVFTAHAQNLIPDSPQQYHRMRSRLFCKFIETVSERSTSTGYRL
jgi:hypothetical protein